MQAVVPFSVVMSKVYTTSEHVSYTTTNEQDNRNIKAISEGRQCEPVLVDELTSTGHIYEVVLVTAATSTGPTAEQYWFFFHPYTAPESVPYSGKLNLGIKNKRRMGI